MIDMMRRITQAAAWQVFLVLIGPPLIAVVAAAIASATDHDRIAVVLVFVAGLLYLATLLAWYWSAGWLLTKVGNGRSSRWAFCLALIVQAVYAIVFYGSFYVPALEWLVDSDAMVALPILLGAYVSWFVANRLIVAERHVRGRFWKTVAAVIMLWVFPIGIWAVQRRLNRLGDLPPKTSSA
jgi:hypothetical protein